MKGIIKTMKKHRIICITLVIVFVLSLAPATRTTAFTPAPETAYAAGFIQSCEGQQWFIDEVEKILNGNQKTLDRITSSADLDIIKSLDFKDRGITGKIPEAIGELKELRTLFMPGNKLSGKIPDGLFTLPKLYNVDLSANAYMGAIPEGFGTMPALGILMLRGNEYTGGIPESILNNEAIKTLDLSGNKLSGAMPAGLNNMSGLEYLAVADNPWTAGPLPDLSALTGLMTLSAWKCNITGEIPGYIYALEDLRILDLADNRLTGSIHEDIGNLTKLQYLALGRNQLEGTLPEGLGSLINLDTLDISANKLRGHVPGELAGVRLVYAQDNYLTGGVLKSLDNNSGNFCDGAPAKQYRLIAGITTASMSAPTNVYTLLRNRDIVTGSTTGKPILPAGCYEAEVDSDPENKIELTFDDNGIFIKALEQIAANEQITIVIRILGNTDSEYSETRLTVSTTAPPVSGGGGAMVTFSGDKDVPEPVAPSHGPYINGYPDGTFRPEREVTREEAAALMVNALGIGTTNGASSSPYYDVEPVRWSAPHILKATEEGFVTGYPDGSFRPGQEMTRAEFAALVVTIMRGYGMLTQADKSAIAFPDVPSDEWYAEYVYEAAAHGLVNGYPDGSFNPDGAVTRAEAVTLANRMLGRDPDTAPQLHTMRNPFSDVDAGHWAYLHILEASSTHEHP